jgi:glycosyltransferase involved in cell wall biosynthesis
VNEVQLGMAARICGIAGPANFQRRLAQGLAMRGIQVSYGFSDPLVDVFLVIGGTRNLIGLWRIRRRGGRIIQRLDGMNWLHRRMRTGLRHFIRAELNNLLLRLIRSRLADAIIYQSDFSKGWWERECGVTRVDSRVICNGVPLDVYTPHGNEERPSDREVVLMVEGNLAGGYEIGLEIGIEFVRRLRDQRPSNVELQVAGSVPSKVKSRWVADPSLPIRWLGLIPPEGIPPLNRSAHMLYAGDPNPACPNAVIEAMACGLPVAAFNTGSLGEIVAEEAGRLADYGSDPWRLEKPDFDGLVHAATEILMNQGHFRSAARERAERMFGLDRMVEAYLEILRSAD